MCNKTINVTDTGAMVSINTDVPNDMFVEKRTYVRVNCSESSQFTIYIYT